MSLVALEVARVIKYVYDNKPPYNSWGEWNNVLELKKDNTYMVVFSIGQEQLEEVFNNNLDKINLLYKAPKAININLHPTQQRNTLYIFEAKE